MLVALKHVILVNCETQTVKFITFLLFQILEVNRISFEGAMTLQSATNILMETTHLQMIVKSNLLGKYFLTFLVLRTPIIIK